MRSERLLHVVALMTVTALLAAPRALVAQDTDLDALLASMTLAEKLTLLHGAVDPDGMAGAGYTPGVARLGIPPLRLTDGPAGVRTRLPATALPAPVMLSATFDPALARRFGEVIGREGRARQQDVLLSPMVNIVRVPNAGRNFETLGEDPLLAMRMVAAEVTGIESQGLIATVKHYVANNFEQDRMNVDAVVGERALREIYLPGFEAAVDAGVGSVMCAYNRVNGEHACENRTLLVDILRGDFGFAGWVMTDWFATHGLGALEAGLDQEMPGLSFGPERPVWFDDSLRVAVETGRIPVAAVDRAVRRILAQMDRMHLLGGGPPRPSIDVEAGAAAAREVALAGAVLLHNRGGTLPLRPADLASLVVIGPTANMLLYGGGGSSRVLPFRTESPVAALRRRAGSGATIRYVPGIDLDGETVPTSALRPSARSAARGLTRTGPAGATEVRPTVDDTGANALPPGSVWTWSGVLTAPVSGEYALKLQAAGASASLSFDGERVLSTGGLFSDASLMLTADSLSNATAVVSLVAGESHPIEVTTGASGPGFFAGPDEPVQIRLAWVTPARRRQFIDNAVRAARSATAAVVFAYDEGTEGYDRATLALPGVQDALVGEIAAANRRTTVVLNTGAPVLMPWIDGTGAVLQMWYPGQEGAEATADLLLGAVSPSGKLPVTFPRSDDDTPFAIAAEMYPGSGGVARYDEGVLVGYRWYDARGVEPLFPFGHGLSYTTFTYSDLQILESSDGFTVRFGVRNAGSVVGEEVPQVYLGPPDAAPVPMEPRRLVGFARIALAPNEQRLVSIHLDRRQLSYWSTARHAWEVAPGRRPVFVGSSSRDIRLHGQLTVADNH